MTIHEAQGQTFNEVIIMQSRSENLQIHDSVPHVVVAVTGHTNTCVYYDDNGDDAIGRFVARAEDLKLLV